MMPECEERECTSVSPKRPRRRWPWWLLAVTAVIVILVVGKPWILPPLVKKYGAGMYDVYELVEYAITIIATGASLYSVGLAVEGGKDMENVFEKLGSLNENIFGRLDKLDADVLAKLEKLDKDVFVKLEKLDKTVIDRLEQLNGDVFDKLEELDYELFSIHEDLEALSQKEPVVAMEAPQEGGDFVHADEIDDSKRRNEKEEVKGGSSDVHEVCERDCQGVL